MPLKQKRKAAGKPNKVDDDTACTSAESSWFNAAANAEQLYQYCQTWSGRRYLDILDVFSFNEGMRHAAGVKVVCSLDIRLSPKHDLTLFVWLSSSVHLRHKMGAYGQIKNFKVRLSNRIVLNCEPR